MLHYKIDDRALDSAKHIAHVRDDHMFSWNVLDDLLKVVRKVCDDDDRRRAGILELMFHLPGRIQWVCVYHDQSRLESANKSNRELQEVRHLYRDPVSFLQA